MPPITYHRHDALLTTTVDITATASTTFTSAAAIDLGQPGGLDECQLVIDCPAPGAGATVTLTVLSSKTEDGEYTETGLTATASGTNATSLRVRVPLDCHKYIKLQAVTGTTAPAAITATLALHV